MGASAEVAKLYGFLSERNIPVLAPQNPDMVLPGIMWITESGLRQNSDNAYPAYARSLLAVTRPYQRKLALAIEFIEGSSGLDLDVRRHGTYRELVRWRGKTGADWPEHLAEKIKVSTVIIGRHSLSATGVGLESHAPLRINIDLDNGRVRQSLVTSSARHSLAA